MAFSWIRTSVMTTLSPGFATNPFSAINWATCASLGVTTPFRISRPLCPMGNERRAKQCSAVRSRISSMRVCGVIFSDGGLGGLVSSADRGNASSKAAVANNERWERFMGIPGLIALYAQSSCQLLVELKQTRFPGCRQVLWTHSDRAAGYERLAAAVSFADMSSRRRRLSRMEGEPLACHLEVERLSAIFADSLLDGLPFALFNQNDDAASASRAANLGRSRAVSRSHGDQLVDERRRNSRCVGAPQVPFFAHEALHVVPLLAGESAMHRLGDARNFGKVVDDMLVTIDVLLEYLPVVDA